MPTGKREFLAAAAKELEYLRNEAALIQEDELILLTYLIDQALVEARSQLKKVMNS